MANWCRLKARRQGVYEEFFQACRDAEDGRSREQHAAVVIQKYARGFVTRLRLDRLTHVVVRIQSGWRGYLGRQRALCALRARDKGLRQAYFDAMATRIQRHWRGFWSRKFVFDFAARKLYLLRVAEMNAKMRVVLAEEADRAAHTQRALAQEAARTTFNQRVLKLHHLLSTTSQPGIFASPYAVASGTVPFIAGQPVEQHLKAAFKKAGPLSQTVPGTGKQQQATFLPRLPTKQAPSGPAAGAAGPAGAAAAAAPSQTSSTRQSHTQPETVLLGGTGQVVPRHMTLRQSVPYDTVHQAEVLEHKVVKAEMLMRHTVPFSHTARQSPPPAIAIQSNRNLLSYHDPFDPTIGQRRETYTPQQARISPTRFTRHPNRHHFFDTGLVPAVEALPPSTFHPAPAPDYAAGLTNKEVRQAAARHLRQAHRPPAPMPASAAFPPA